MINDHKEIEIRSSQHDRINMLAAVGQPDRQTSQRRGHSPPIFLSFERMK